MIAFSLWSVDIYWYWIFYVVAFFSAYLFLYYISRDVFFSKYPKIKTFLRDNLDDLVLLSILWVLVWWRLWHVIIYDLAYYLKNPLEIVQFWKWWMSFIWWMIGVFLSLLIFAKLKKLKKSDLILLFDLILCIAPLWILIWRIGNFLNQELYWIIVPSWYWWFSIWFVKLLEKLHIFYVYEKIDNFLRINTNFLASFFEWFISFVFVSTLFLIFKKRWKFRIWLITGVFLLRYSLVRFFLEYLRFDSQSEFVFYLTKSQWFFVLFFIVGLYFIFFEKKSFIVK